MLFSDGLNGKSRFGSNSWNWEFFINEFAIDGLIEESNVICKVDVKYEC